MLAKLEETKPLESPKYYHTGIWLEKEIKPFLSSGEDIENYLHEVVVNKQVFHQKTLETLLEVTYSRSHQSNVYHGILSRLSETMTYTELLEVMAMGMWHQFYVLKISYSYFSYPLNDMYILLQKIKQPMSEILEFSRILVEKYPIPAVRMSIFLLFPDSFNLPESDKKHLSDMSCSFSKHFVRFFNLKSAVKHSQVCHYWLARQGRKPQE